MAQRQGQGVLSGLIEQAAMLPWWAALLLAVLSYVGCHALAGMSVAASEQPTAAVYIKTLAVALQYLLPLLFVILAGLSAYGRSLKKQQAAEAQAAREPAAPRARPRSPQRAGTSTFMACPKCGSLMVQRTVQEGPDAGKLYWGCTKAPLCQETLSL